eukprot:SAG22_NODE_326_length_12283_cov_248.386408_4_plen_46_part_00
MWSPLTRTPRGSRSWNLYGNNVNQQLIMGIMDGMVTKRNALQRLD